MNVFENIKTTFNLVVQASLNDKPSYYYWYVGL